MSSKLLCIFILFVGLLGETLANQANLVGLDFIYIRHPLHAPDTKEAIWRDRVLPYATLRFQFPTTLSPSDKREFQARLRVFRRVGDKKNAREVGLAHLHEVRLNPAVEVHGPHASFHWQTTFSTNLAREVSVLDYRPFDLAGGHSYRIQIDPLWRLKNAHFSTLPFSGNDTRVYQMLIPGLRNWVGATSQKDGQLGVNRNYVLAHFLDDNLNSPNRGFYESIEVRVRGTTSPSWRQKSYTVRFSGDNPFVGFRNDWYSPYGIQFRKHLVFTGARTFNDHLHNKIVFDTARYLEQKYWGGKLTVDTYFAHLVINGQYWGQYLISELYTSGKLGWNRTAEKKQHFNMHDHIFLHKLNLFRGKSHRPQGLHEEGVRVRWTGVTPKGEIHHTLNQGRGGVVDLIDIPFEFPIWWENEGNSEHPDFQTIDVAVSARLVGQDIKTLLKPDPVVKVTGENPLDLFAPMREQGNGKISLLNTSTPLISAFFPAVKANTAVKLEYLSTHDFDLFHQTLTGDNPDEALNWVHHESFFITTFLSRLFNLRDNDDQNLYLFMNANSHASFLNEDGAPHSPYYFLLWDCNEWGPPTGRLFGPEYRWARVFGESEQMQFNYHQLLKNEKSDDGGVLTKNYYTQLFKKYREEIGNGYWINAFRWQFFENDPKNFPTLDTHLTNFREQTLFSKFDHASYIDQYVLKLAPDENVPRPFLRGDANQDGLVDMADVLTMLNRLFLIDIRECLFDICDVDDSGFFSLNDAIFLSEFLASNGQCPPPPFDSPGFDPTPDRLPGTP